MTFHNISTILIWSEHYKRLADWYQTTLNLKVNKTLTYADDTGILFEFPNGGPWLWIGQPNHSVTVRRKLFCNILRCRRKSPSDHR
jgi:hypothetical protein